MGNNLISTTTEKNKKSTVKSATLYKVLNAKPADSRTSGTLLTYPSKCQIMQSKNSANSEIRIKMHEPITECSPNSWDEIVHESQQLTLTSTCHHFTQTNTYTLTTNKFHNCIK